MSDHDHVLMFKGIWEGIPEFDLDCIHIQGDKHFHVDHEGRRYDDCLVQEWWEAEGINLVQCSAHTEEGYGELRYDNEGNIKLWTHWLPFEGECQLLGIGEHNTELEVNDVQREGDPVGVWSETGA